MRRSIPGAPRRSKRPIGRRRRALVGRERSPLPQPALEEDRHAWALEWAERLDRARDGSLDLDRLRVLLLGYAEARERAAAAALRAGLAARLIHDHGGDLDAARGFHAHGRAVLSRDLDPSLRQRLEFGWDRHYARARRTAGQFVPEGKPLPWLCPYGRADIFGSLARPIALSSWA